MNEERIIVEFLKADAEENKMTKQQSDLLFDKIMDGMKKGA